MGTFHPQAHELHGITCVVDRGVAGLAVGRVDTADERGVVLLDADTCPEALDSPARLEWLARAAQWGVWKTHDRLLVPAAEVTSIRRLGDLR